VPFFTYPSGIQIRQIREELVQLQNTYGLSDIYLFSSGTTVQAVSLRTYPLRRLEKVIGASSSTNYGALLKYKQLFFRIGTAYDEKGREVYPAPHYIGTIEANEEQNGHFVSFPHYTFFQEWGIPLREYVKMHGNGPVSITHAVVELSYRRNRIFLLPAIRLSLKISLLSAFRRRLIRCHNHNSKDSGVIISS
jgi:hypothetical protein